MLNILFLQILFGKYLLFVLILFNVLPCRGNDKVLSEDEMHAALDLYNVEGSKLCHNSNIAQWNSVTDVGNKEKEEEKVSFSNAKYTCPVRFGSKLSKKILFQNGSSSMTSLCNARIFLK